MYHTLINGCTVLLLSLYFVATVAYHFDKTNWIIRHVDFFGLIPKWNFFAPTPGVHNMYLLFRFQNSDGSIGSWRSLFDLDKFRSPWTFIWNPNRRLKKALFDLVGTLALEDASTEENKVRIKMSIPYLLILNHLGSYTDGMCTGIQFVVMENYDDNPSYAIFTSELHTL